MVRGYYGSEDTGVRIEQTEYPGIHTPQDLYDALGNVWCEYTCTPRLRKDYDKPTLPLTKRFNEKVRVTQWNGKFGF